MSYTKISICCITYNHESYIRKCIDGFIMQKTDFLFDVLIHDDASTDKTADIIREYEAKYPDIVKPIYQKENQYSQGIRPINKFNFERSNAKYIAMCEGDDYWTDPYKLQKQVDFLEENGDCSLCFHASKHINTNNPDKFHVHHPKIIPTDYKFEMKHVILGGGGFMATNSMVFLKEHIMERPEWMDKVPIGDLPLMLLLASKGKIGYVDDVMSVYRIMSSSTSWGASMQNQNRAKKHHYAILKMWSDFDNWTNRKYHKYVLKKMLKNRWNHQKSSIKYILKSLINKS